MKTLSRDDKGNPKEPSKADLDLTHRQKLGVREPFEIEIELLLHRELRMAALARGEKRSLTREVDALLEELHKSNSVTLCG